MLFPPAMESERQQAETERAVKKRIRKVVLLAAKKTEHIPPINFQAKGPMTFSFEVGAMSLRGCCVALRNFRSFLQIRNGKRADSGWGWFSRLMKTEPPRFGV